MQTEYTRDSYMSMYHAYKKEVLEHKDTKDQADRRLRQIQHLLIENAQLKRELERERKNYTLLI